MKIVTGVPIINLAKHKATDKQKQQGLVDCDINVASLLRGNSAPSTANILKVVDMLVDLAKGYEYAYVNCPIQFVVPLVDALFAAGITPVYAYGRINKAQAEKEHVNFYRHEYK